MSSFSSTSASYSLFQLIRLRFDVVIQAGHPDLFFSKISVMKGNNCCCTDCIKSSYVGMHSNVYEPIYLKLGMPTDNIEGS